MNYATIAVHVNASRHMFNRARYASELALAFQAHLVGMATTGAAETNMAAGLTGEGAAMIGAYLDFSKERALTSLAVFEGVAENAGVGSYEKRLVDEEAGFALCLQSRYSDLLILGQNDPQEEGLAERADVPAYVLIHSGRPVLLLPHTAEFQFENRHALIAWNGSQEAARAIYGALPLLHQFKKVDVVIFNPMIGSRRHGEHGEEPGADIATYLARHGLNVEVTIKTTNSEGDSGNALLTYAADTGTDLLVMGAYGHSRVREFALGGATRIMLHSMTVPVLMAH